MRGLLAVFLLTFASVSISTAATAPYFGKWKINSAKSQINEVATIEKLPSGEYRFEEQGFVYQFKLDGKEYPMPDGGTTSWKALSDDVWEVTNRANGKVNVKFKLTLKGDTMTSSVTVYQADGKEISQTGTSKRVSKGTGFVGVWKLTQVDASQSWLEITPEADNGVKIASLSSLCIAKFDGKPYPMTGSGDGPKWTMSFRKSGPASFETTSYLDGKVMAEDVYTVSADGKVLTDISTPAAAGSKPSKTILDRQ